MVVVWYGEELSRLKSLGSERREKHGRWHDWIGCGVDELYSHAKFQNPANAVFFVLYFPCKKNSSRLTVHIEKKSGQNCQQWIREQQTLNKTQVLTFTLKGGRGCLEVPYPLSGISGLSFDSPFLSPLLFFCTVLLLFLSCPFSCIFKKKILKYFWLRVRLFLYGSC